ncbi:phage head closure protein [Bacillus gobiensis]|uniref:phage head closure protein n=1 Tax=Bacillus gobiensis TaxID=1441095 RepID=UPI003D1D6AD7
MNPGEFNKRVEIQEYRVTKVKGMAVKSYETVATRWAAVKTTQGREFFQSGAVNTEYTTRFVFRYTKSIMDLLGKNTRIKKSDGATYNVVSAINDNDQNVTITVMTKLVNQNGA